MSIRKKIPRDVMRPLTLTVVIVMIIAAVIIRYIQHFHTSNQQVEEWMNDQPQSLSEILDNFLPDEEQLNELFSPRLEEEAQTNFEIEFLARDAGLTRIVINKPMGAGPFPSIILLHGGESSSRATDQIARTLGQELSSQFDAITISVDWRESALGEDEMNDVVSSISWVQKTDPNNTQPTILFGLGRGAYLGLLALQEANVDALIMAYPYVDPYQQYNHLLDYNELDARAYLDQTGCSGYSSQVETCLKALSLADSLDLSIPAYMINSTGNDFIPIEQTDIIADLINSELMTYTRIQDDNVQHDFFTSSLAEGFEIAWEDLTDWLQEFYNNNSQITNTVTNSNTNSSSIGDTPIIINSNTNNSSADEVNTKTEGTINTIINNISNTEAEEPDDTTQEEIVEHNEQE